MRHVELCIANAPKTYPVADDEALKDLLQELDQEVIDANHDLIRRVLQRMGSEPGPLVSYYPQVAFIENGDKLAVVKRYGCKPRLALFALLKMLPLGTIRRIYFTGKVCGSSLPHVGPVGPHVIL